MALCFNSGISPDLRFKSGIQLFFEKWHSTVLCLKSGIELLFKSGIQLSFEKWYWTVLRFKTGIQSSFCFISRIKLSSASKVVFNCCLLQMSHSAFLWYRSSIQLFCAARVVLNSSLYMMCYSTVFARKVVHVFKCLCKKSGIQLFLARKVVFNCSLRFIVDYWRRWISAVSC